MPVSTNTEAKVKAAAKAASRAARRERREGSAGGPGHHNAVVVKDMPIP